MNAHEKFFSKIGFNYLIYAIIAIILQIIVINITGILNPAILSDYNKLTILSAICNYIIPFPILFYLMGKIKTQKIEKNKLSLKTFLTYICIAITLMWVGNIMGLAITVILGHIIQTDIANPVQTLISSTDIWLNLLIISIIGPVFEEIFFRKLLIDRTIKYGAKVSILLSALIFGLFHGNLNQFFYAFMLGGFFAYVYIKTGKVTNTILLHIIVNLMGSVVSLFVAGSVENLAAGLAQASDIAILAAYLGIVFVSFFIGVIKISGYSKIKLNGTTDQIKLEKPIKTIIANPGIILFIGFCIAMMIRQITG